MRACVCARVRACVHSKDAAELFVFQRTPSSVGERNNRDTDAAYAEKMLSAPGWQRERMVNFVKMTQTPDPSVDDLIQIVNGNTDLVSTLNCSPPFC